MAVIVYDKQCVIAADTPRLDHRMDAKRERADAYKLIYYYEATVVILSCMRDCRPAICVCVILAYNNKLYNTYRE